MIPVILDFGDVVKEFSLLNEQIDAIKEIAVEEVTGIIYDSWRKQAFDNLGSSRSSYINGLIVVDEGIYSKSIILTGQFNNMIEFGAPAFDMKEGFSKSDKVKYSANGGWYLTIPFSWSGPSSSDDNQKMPSDIHQIAKNEGKITPQNLPDKYSKPKERGKITTAEGRIYQRYKHKSSIFTGITKNQATYGASTQSTYTSMRRVGEMSDPNSWIHPGIKPHNLAKLAVDNVDIDAIVNNIVNEQLINLGF
jgi:hypothetical protein